MSEELIMNGRNVGQIDKEKGCYVSFRGPKHWFRIYRGWGISVKVLDYLIENDIEYVIINDNNQRVWYANISTILVYGQEYKDEDDEQLILCIDKWKIYQEEEKPKIHPKLNIHQE